MTVAIAAAILVTGAVPAYAHSVAGTGGTNYKTTLRAVTPSIAGVKLKVIEAGSRLELTYTGAKTVYVLAFTGERYLRVDRRGIFENLNSPYTYINKTRDGVEPPGSVDPRKPPEWNKVSGGRVARWHDHRVHHMGDIDPPQVRRAPGDRHVIIPDWQVSITDGTTTAVARGDLVWVPGPSPIPWFLLALGLLVLMALASRLAAPYLPVAAALAALIVVDIAHAYAIGFANGGTTGERLSKTFAASIVAIPAWLVGAGGVWFLLRRRVDGFFAAVFTGLIGAVVGGLADLNNLSKSQIAFALPSDWARPIVATSLGLGIGIAVASALAIRRLEPQPAAPAADPA